MISINQAAAQGIAFLRIPKWINKEDHIKIDIIDGKAGPWVHLYSPINIEMNGKNPIDVLMIDGRDDEEYEPYEVKK